MHRPDDQLRCSSSQLSIIFLADGLHISFRSCVPGIAIDQSSSKMIISVTK